MDGSLTVTVCQIYADADFLAFGTNLTETRKIHQWKDSKSTNVGGGVVTRVFWANLSEESRASNINKYHTAAVDQNCLNIDFPCFCEKIGLSFCTFQGLTIHAAAVFHSLPDSKKSCSEKKDVLAMPLS